MNDINEPNGIHIKDLDQWFDEELKLYGGDGDHSSIQDERYDAILEFKRDALKAAKTHIIFKAALKIISE